MGTSRLKFCQRGKQNYDIKIQVTNIQIYIKKIQKRGGGNHRCLGLGWVEAVQKIKTQM